MKSCGGPTSSSSNLGLDGVSGPLTATRECATTVTNHDGSCSYPVRLYVIPELPNLPYQSVARVDTDVPTELCCADESFNTSGPIDAILGAGIYFASLIPGLRRTERGLTIQNSVFGWLSVARVDTDVPTELCCADESFNTSGPIDAILGAGIYFASLIPGLRRTERGLTIQNSVFGWLVGGLLRQDVAKDVRRAINNLKVGSPTQRARSPGLTAKHGPLTHDDLEDGLQGILRRMQATAHPNETDEMLTTGRGHCRSSQEPTKQPPTTPPTAPHHALGTTLGNVHLLNAPADQRTAYDVIT
uniref:Peptidase aspartic putative domain-containing protein n=1 Tax=Anopheles atroparvus TaxID=41427 RepID=A0A182JD13_ANOAO